MTGSVTLFLNSIDFTMKYHEGLLRITLNLMCVGKIKIKIRENYVFKKFIEILLLQNVNNV